MKRWASITTDKVITQILVDNDTMRSWVARNLGLNKGFWVLLPDGDTSSVGDVYTNENPFEEWVAVNSTGLRWELGTNDN